MKCTMLGTGCAVVTEVYNTCYVLEHNHQYLLVDGGGGNTLLQQLKAVHISWRDLRHIFVTHKHIDHILGIVWMVRMICQHMSQDDYEGEAYIYGHEEVIALIRQLAFSLLQPKQAEYLNSRLHLITLAHGDQHELIGHTFIFFDIHSTKARQFGYTIDLGCGEKLACCGDEPYNPINEEYVKNSTWLFHESFCLFQEVDQFHPYEKHHSTVKDTCHMASRLGIKNLLIYHTKDNHGPNRKEIYLEEGKQYFNGNLYVPDDLETIEIPSFL